MLWAPDVESVPAAAALLQISRAWPPAAVESLNTCPDPGGRISDSPATVRSAASAAGSGRARAVRATARTRMAGVRESRGQVIDPFIGTSPIGCRSDPGQGANRLMNASALS